MDALSGAGQPRAGVDMEKIRKSVLGDIERARSFFEEKVEPVLRERHRLFEADRKFYKQRFPELSKQSDFVSFDFWSLVQWAIPRIMNAFFNGGDALVVIGRNGEDVERAEVLKALIDFQIMTQNKGFLLLWDWFSDAFEYNLGAVKVRWERQLEWKTERAENIPYDRLVMMAADPSIQIMDVGPPDPFGFLSCAYQARRVAVNRPVLEPARVTELRWSPEARSLAEANFVAHRKLVTADHLRRQASGGVYDPEAVERAIVNGRSGGISYLSFERELNDELDAQRPPGGGSEDEDARQIHELHECYTKLDVNGDGLLEDALVTVVGEEIVRVEENPYTWPRGSGSECE
jgi:hypothetical protein